MLIYCCGCSINVEARLTNGFEIYNSVKYQQLPFWKCDSCGNYVGCHHKTHTPTKPLGSIPTPELRNARNHIHKILDPLWKSGKYKRSSIYKDLSDLLGFAYHTAELNDIETAREVYRFIKNKYK